MDENNSKKIWTYIQEAGDKLVGKLHNSRNHPKLDIKKAVSRRYNLIPLLPSGPGGVHRELAVPPVQK